MSQVYLVHSQADRIAATELVALAESQDITFVSIDFDPEAENPQSYEWGIDVHRKLRDCAAAVVLCSEASMGSRWIAAELAHVRAAGKALYAVRLDECVLAPEVCEYDVIDVRSDRRNAWQQLWIALSVSGLGGPKAFDWDPTRPPYPGLAGYDEDDAAVFFGRDADVRSALARFYTMHRTGDVRMMTLVGPPGAGKASLVRAGLLPRLSRDGQRFITLDTLRLDADPFAGLAASIAGVFRRFGEPMDKPSLADGLRAAATNPDARTAIRLTRRLAGQIDSRLRRVAGRLEATPLLFVPRIERLLVADDSVGRGFLGLMRILLDAPDKPLTVIATLDSDYVRDLQVHHAMRGLNNELCAVQPLSPSQLRTALQGPANAAGVKLERGLTKRIFADAMSIGDPELRQASVAFVLHAMWQEHGEQGFIGRAHYEALRPLPRVIGDAAENALGVTPRRPKVDPRVRQAVCGVVRFDRLRRAMPLVVQANDVAGLGDTTIDKMVRRRLLHRHEDGQIEAPRALFASWPRAVKWLIDERRTRPSQGMPAAEIPLPAKAEAPPQLAQAPSFAPVADAPPIPQHAPGEAMIEGPTERDDEPPEPTLWDEAASSPDAVEPDESATDAVVAKGGPEPDEALGQAPAELPVDSIVTPPLPAQEPPEPVVSAPTSTEAVPPPIALELPEPPHRKDARVTPPPLAIEDQAPLSPAVAQWAPPPPPMAPSTPGLKLAAYSSSAVPPLSGRRGRAFGVAFGMLAVLAAGGAWIWTQTQGEDEASPVAPLLEDEAAATTEAANATDNAAPAAMTATTATGTDAPDEEPAAVAGAATPVAVADEPTAVAASDTPPVEPVEALADKPGAAPAQAPTRSDQAGVVARVLAAESPLTALLVLTSLDPDEHPRDGLSAALKLDTQVLAVAETRAANGPLNMLQWDRSGRLVAAGDKQRLVILDVDANATIASLEGEGFVDARIGPKSRGLLTLHDDGKARWRPAFDAEPVLVGDTPPPQPGRGWKHVAINDDETEALVVARGTVIRLALDGSKQPREELLGSGKIRDVGTSAGRFVAITTSANVLKMWKWRDGRPSDRLIDRISFSQRKRRFVAATMTTNASMLVSADVGPAPGAPADRDRVAITVWHRNTKGYWWNLRARFLRQVRVGTLKAQLAIADDGSVAMADLVRVVRDGSPAPKHVIWMFERADWRRFIETSLDVALDPSARFFVERTVDGKSVLRPRHGDGQELTGARITGQRFARKGTRLVTAHVDGMVRAWDTARRHHTVLGWQAAKQVGTIDPVTASFNRDQDGRARIGTGPAAGSVLRDAPTEMKDLVIHAEASRAFAALPDRVFVWRTDSPGAPMVAALPDCDADSTTRFSSDGSHLVHRCGARTKTLLVDWKAILAKLRDKAPGCLSRRDRKAWLGEDDATAAKRHTACMNASAK